MAASLACGAGTGEGEVWSGEGAGDEVDDAVGIGGGTYDRCVTVDVERGPVTIAVSAGDDQTAECRARRGVDESAVSNGVGETRAEGVAGEEIERGVVDVEAECGNCLRSPGDCATVLEIETVGEREILIERDGSSLCDREKVGREGVAGRRQGRGGAVDSDTAREVEILAERQGSAVADADGDADAVAGFVAEGSAIG